MRSHQFQNTKHKEKFKKNPIQSLYDVDIEHFPKIVVLHKFWSLQTIFKEEKREIAGKF